MTTLGPTLALPVTIQLTNGTTCWQATYETNVKRNTATQFKARAN